MFCKKCGTQLNAAQKFCPKCGMSLEGINVPPPTPPTPPPTSPPPSPFPPVEEYDMEFEAAPPKKKRKIKRYIVLVAIVAVVVIGVVGFFKSPVRQVMEAWDDGSYESAAEIYNEEVADNFIWNLLADLMLGDYVGDTMSEYEEGTITYDEAIERLTALIDFNNDAISASAAETLTAIENLQSSQDVFDEAEALYNEGEYIEASELYAQVSEDSPNYDEAQSKLDSCHELYVAEVLESTSSPSTQSDYKSYLSVLSVALSAFPDDEDLLERQSELEDGYLALVKSDALSDASDAVADEDYETAISVLEDALDILTDDSELTNMLASVQSGYEDSIVLQVEDLVDDGNYDGALSLLSEALTVLPESTVLGDLYTSTSDSKPVTLSSLPLSESDGSYSLVTEQTVTTDTIGNTYSPGNLYKFSYWYDGGYVKYYLGGQYTTLRFTLAVSAENEDYLNSTNLTIYGDDDDILYTSGDLTRTTAPRTVSVDVSDVEWLYIRSDSDSSRYCVTLLVADPVLYKD